MTPRCDHPVDGTTCAIVKGHPGEHRTYWYPPGSDEHRAWVAWLIAWCEASLRNCERLAAEKKGNDRDGWLDDAEHYGAIIDQLRGVVGETVTPLNLTWRVALLSLDRVEMEKLPIESLRGLADCLQDLQRRVFDATCDRREEQGQI